jgi:hypothetical protein
LNVHPWSDMVIDAAKAKGWEGSHTIFLEFLVVGSVFTEDDMTGYLDCYIPQTVFKKIFPEQASLSYGPCILVKAIPTFRGPTEKSLLCILNITIYITCFYTEYINSCSPQYTIYDVENKGD